MDMKLTMFPVNESALALVQTVGSEMRSQS